MRYLERDEPFSPVHTHYAFYISTMGAFALLENRRLYYFKNNQALKCIPSALVDLYIYENHDTPLAAHGGVTTTVAKLRETLLLALSME